MQFVFLLEQVVNGLVLGGYYLLIALGLSLIFSVGGVVNLAHGAFYAFGAYVASKSPNIFGFGPAVVLSPVAVAMLGILFERYMLRRFYTRRPDPQPARDLRPSDGSRAVDPHHLGCFALWPHRCRPGFKGLVMLGDFLFSRYRLMLLAVVALVMIGSYGFCSTRPRSAAWCAPACSGLTWSRRWASGCSRYMTAIVMLGVGMAGLAGAMFAPITVVHPAMGAEIIIVAFVVVVIGGLGSFWGVVLAALLVGVVRGVTIHFAPAAGEASMYVLMFLVLMFRPRGLLGERIEKFE